MLTAETKKPPLWMTLGAFAVIYLVWGSTFLAIRVGVLAMPPLLFAAMRFLTAGVVLVGWQLSRRDSLPTARQWRSVVVIAFLLFLVDYGLLFWAEQRVPSGVAAVVMATIPAGMTLMEVALLGTQRLTVALVTSLLIGLFGVAVLVSPGLHLSGAVVNRAGAGAMLIAAVAWSIGSVLMKKLELPASRAMSAGTQMLAGGTMLLVAAAGFGEFHGFHPSAVSRGAWFALAYLITAGSLLGFTAYLWLMHHQSPTVVGTYAYVNPVVAVVLGFFVAHEPLGVRTVIGAACVLVSVGLITLAKKK